MDPTTKNSLGLNHTHRMGVRKSPFWWGFRGCYKQQFVTRCSNRKKKPKQNEKAESLKLLKIGGDDRGGRRERI